MITIHQLYVHANCPKEVYSDESNWRREVYTWIANDSNVINKV